jgi:hypothetical protein
LIGFSSLSTSEQAGCSGCVIEAEFILIDVEIMSCAVKKAALKLLCLGKLSEEYASRSPLESNGMVCSSRSGAVRLNRCFNSGGALAKEFNRRIATVEFTRHIYDAGG